MAKSYTVNPIDFPFPHKLIGLEESIQGLVAALTPGHTTLNSFKPLWFPCSTAQSCIRRHADTALRVRLLNIHMAYSLDYKKVYWLKILFQLLACLNPGSVRRYSSASTR